MLADLQTALGVLFKEELITGNMAVKLCVRRLNLASFVTTWMEPECDELVSEARNINYIDEVREAASES